jgi:hypothetical protein
MAPAHRRWTTGWAATSVANAAWGRREVLEVMWFDHSGGSDGSTVTR